MRFFIYMATRLRPRHQEDVRKKIQTSQLINRLENHALENLELSASQIRAIEILLNKTLPNLQSTEITGDEDNPLNVVTKIELVAFTDTDANKG